MGGITENPNMHDGWLYTSLATRNSATSADLAKPAQSRSTPR